jgi:protein ImuB
MQKRFMYIWFRHLTTDWLTLRKPELKDKPFVFGIPDHGRLVITATNPLAEKQGITVGMVAADAKAIYSELEVVDEIPDLPAKLLKGIGEWCIRYSPIISVDLHNGLVLDISGCTHLWGGERKYLTEIVTRLRSKGYDVRASIADTIGTAWAIARFGKVTPIIEYGEQSSAILDLPPAALRLDSVILEKLQKLGFRSISSFISIQRSVLRRRFGTGLLLRLDQALGNVEEYIDPIVPIEAYQERLPCLEPIRTATGIEIALQRLLEMLCKRLHKEGKGVRTATFKGYRIDGNLVQIGIGTNRATHNINHLFKLFELKISTIEPALGIELFVLEASKVEDVSLDQEALWIEERNGLDNLNVAELLDRLASKVGANTIHRYLPEEHYWPERSIKQVASLQDKANTTWRNDRPRPVKLLPYPQRIDVTAPIPDYPPMLFRYKGIVHHIKKADGPERIEREWWLDTGEHRDYYTVEDEEGKRYWLFRSGHYSGEQSQWFIHGFFA